MDGKLFDSELKVMGVLWNEGDCTAKHISDVLKEDIGWNMNTTYTLSNDASKKALSNAQNQISCAMLWSKKNKFRKNRLTS